MKTLVRSALLVWLSTIAALIWPDVSQAGTVACAGIDDTTDIQASIDADAETIITGTCAIPGQPGIHIPSDRTVKAYGAVLSQGPNIGGAGVLGRNRIIETTPGSARITWYGGRFIGSRPYVGGLQWSIGFRVDSADDVLVQDVTFEDFYTDGMSIGGNLPGSTSVTLRNVKISNSKRNGLSITCGNGINIENSIFETTNCLSDAVGGVCSAVELNMPRCGVDVEPNFGDVVSNLRVTDSISRLNERCGWFIQSGLAAPGTAGSNYVFEKVRAESNGTNGFIGNQVKKLKVLNGYVSGGTVGWSFGAGVSDLTFEDSEVTTTSGNGVNFAGVLNPSVRHIKVNGESVVYIAIVSPVVMNGIAGKISIEPYE